MGGIFPGDPVVPGDPPFGGTRPGPEAVSPDIKVYGVADKRDAIGLLRNKATRRIKGLGAETEGMRN